MKIDAGVKCGLVYTRQINVNFLEGLLLFDDKHKILLLGVTQAGYGKLSLLFFDFDLNGSKEIESCDADFPKEFIFSWLLMEDKILVVTVRNFLLVFDYVVNERDFSTTVSTSPSPSPSTIRSNIPRNTSGESVMNQETQVLHR